MLDFLRDILDSDRFAPHGYCLLWQPELIWTHVIADATIGIAYFSIPIAIAYFLTRRRDVQFGWVVWMFAAFIMACGLTHFFAIWTLWQPDYGPEALVKAATAVVSLFTAVALWPLLPRAIALPSPAQLQRANADLLLRIGERDAALDALRRETEERLRAEEMLRQSQKMEAIGQLSGGIAHDFNNMLTIVLANLDRAQRLLGEDHKVREALAKAELGAERAADLTDRLLSFARKQALQPARHDPNGIVATMRAILTPTLGGTITLDADLAPDAWQVRVDANQMENAILNLAVNARHAMPSGGRLTLATRNIPDGDGPAPGEWVEIMVADNGLGMTEEVRLKAFDPFYTTREVGEGSGLGLSQVHGFITQSDGHVVIESEPGRGTIVRMYLPRAR